MKLAPGIMPYPEVVESRVGESLSCDIFGKRFDHSGLLHRQDRSRDEFSVVSDGEVPRPDPHHVVERELHDQPALRVDLQVKILLDADKLGLMCRQS